MARNNKATALALIFLMFTSSSYAKYCTKVFSNPTGKMYLTRSLDLAYLRFIHQDLLRDRSPVPRLLREIDTELYDFLAEVEFIKKEYLHTNEIKIDPNFKKDWIRLTEYFYLLREIDKEGEGVELALSYLKMLDFDLSNPRMPSEVEKRIRSHNKVDEVRVLRETFRIEEAFRS